MAAALAVQVLGLFVVFAALIAPALWRRAGASWPLALALAAALVACIAGLTASWLLDLPSGPCVAAALAAAGLFATARRAGAS